MKNIIHNHQNKLEQYDLMIKSKSYLKHKIVISIDSNDLMGLCDNDTKFSGVSSYGIMYYLYKNYGNIK